MVRMTSGSEPWYAEGLRFSCTRCGRCCGGAPGNVFLDENEVTAIAERLGLDRAAFKRRYTRRVYRKGTRLLSLVERPNHDCIFFERDRGCTVYQDRPRQCRTWPFWRGIVASRERWDETAEECPGMNRGELVPAERIAETAAEDGLP